MKSLHNPRSVLFLLASFAAIVLASASGGGKADPKPETVPRPAIRLASPQGAGFVMGSWSEAKIVIVLEITDVSGAGIQSDDFGEPRLVEPNHNAEVFLDHLVARGSYVDGKGHDIIQLVAQVPTDDLEIGEFRLTPPVDESAIPEDVRRKEQGFTMSADALLPAVDFRFQVRDRNGAESEVFRLAFAVAQNLYRGPYLPPPVDDKKPD